MKSGRSNLSNCKILWNNENTQFGIKNTLFRYFWAKIFKKYCHIWNQHPQICLIGNFCEKQNCLNLGPKMPYLGIFELELEKTIWNQHSRICLIAKFGKKKKKCLNLRPKIPCLGIFGIELEKKHCHIWNQQSRISQNWVFNSCNEFLYRVRFF